MTDALLQVLNQRFFWQIKTRPQAEIGYIMLAPSSRGTRWREVDWGAKSQELAEGCGLVMLWFFQKFIQWQP